MAVTRIKSGKTPTSAKPGCKALRKAPRPIVRASKSGILAAVHESISDLHEAGVVGVETMREFDQLCIEPVAPR